MPDAPSTTALTRPARPVPPDRLGPIVGLTVGLWLAALVLGIALLATPVSIDRSGLMSLTESYGALERVALWQDATAWLPVGAWPKPAIAWVTRLAMAAMFALHALAFVVARRGTGSPWRWLPGPAGAMALLLLMPPSNADVFFYAISGDLANSGRNPYTTPLYEAFDHPLYPFNHWVDMTTVYGPVWTLFNQGIMAVTGPDPVRAVLAYKLVLGGVALVVAGGTRWVARRLGATPARATAAMVLVAWQPSLLIETAGQAHNDIVMIALSLAAVALVLAGAGRATTGAVVLAALAVGVKYVALPVVALVGLTRLATRQVGRVARGWAVDAVAALAVLVAAFAPWWTGPAVVREMLSEPGRLYTNPIWRIPASLLRAVDADAGRTFEDATRLLAQVAAISVVAFALAWFGRRCWLGGTGTDEPPWGPALVRAWAAIALALAFIPVNAHPWYWLWPVVPVALVTATTEHSPGPWTRPRWLAAWLALTAVLTLIYHTRIVTP